MICQLFNMFIKKYDNENMQQRQSNQCKLESSQSELQQCNQSQQPDQCNSITTIIGIGDDYFIISFLANEYYARSISGNTKTSFFKNLGFKIGDFVTLDCDLYLSLKGDVEGVLNLLIRSGLITIANKLEFMLDDCNDQDRIRMDFGYYFDVIKCQGRNTFFVYDYSNTIIYGFTIHDDLAQVIRLTY